MPKTNISSGGGLNIDSSNPTILDGSVTTAKIADDTITAAKLQINSVTTTKIADGAVTQSKRGSPASSYSSNTVSGSLTSGVDYASVTLYSSNRVILLMVSSTDAITTLDNTGNFRIYRNAATLITTFASNTGGPVSYNGFHVVDTAPGVGSVTYTLRPEGGGAQINSGSLRLTAIEL